MLQLGFATPAKINTSICISSQPKHKLYKPYRRVVHVASTSNDDQPTEPQPAPTPPPATQQPPASTSRPSLVDPVQTIEWGGTLPSPRRALLGGLAGLSIVLVGNFLGVTSFLLGLDGGKTAGALRLDVLYPIKGYKRCVDYDNGYEFIYPANWLADQRLYRRYAERMEKERSLDPPAPRQMKAKLREQGVPEPSAGFGPPGGTGEDNISVIVAPIRPGFTLQGMGTPTEAAERFLLNTVAPPGGDRIATLITASSHTDASGEVYYCMEFVVEFPGRFKRHNVAVYGARNGYLYTLNAQCADRFWKQYSEQFTTAAKSFRIIASGAGTPDYPSQL